MKTRIFSLFATFALLFSVSAVAQTNGDADAPTYYYWYGIHEGTLANPSSPINASNYTTLAEASSELKESLTIDAQKGYAYVLVPNTVTEVKWFNLTFNVYSTVHFNVVDTSIPGHLVYKSESPSSGGEAGKNRLDFTYGEVDNNYYYWYGIQDGTVANPSSPINASNYTTLAESSSELKESLKIDAQKGYAYVLVPNTVTEVKWFDLNAGAYSTMKFNVIDTSIPGHLVYRSENPFGSGNVRLDFTYGEVDNNYYYYYGIQDGTVANPSSPINANNYTTLAESSSTLKESMTINTKKGWMYILVPNTVTEIKLFDLNAGAYSTVHFNVVDTSIPGHFVYKSEAAASSGKGRLDFTYGEYIVVTGITLDRTNVELAEGETTTLVATVAPDDATVKMVAWSTSDEAIATVDNGVVTAVAAGTATITAKAGDKEATCVVTVTKKEEPEPSVASGEYYLYHAESKRFLSRGEHWGTCATVDRYGIPFVWTAEEYSLKFLDSNVCLFETDDSNIYTDNNSTGFAFEEVEGGYLLKSQKSDRYLTIGNAAFTHQIVNVTDDASAAVVWQLKSKAEHDAIVAAYVEENYTSVIGAAGITATAGAFVDYLATLNAVDMTSAIGTARFEGSVGSWTYNEVRGQENQPAYGTDFCELWQATGNHAQTITGLAEGIYKVTVQGFERSGSWATCNTLAEKGYEITTATLSANGEETNLKSWYSGKSDESNPNNTDEAVAKFADGLYQNEVYTYVGKDGTLTLTLCKPGHVDDNWVLFNNFTLTRYTGSVAVTGITLSQAEATLTEGESLTLTATVAPDNATDKAVTWSSSNAAVATVDDNGKVTAVAEGTATITAKAGDKEATCVVTVEKKAEEIVYAEIANGDYYLKNVGSGKFLTGANDWGTQASLGEYGLSITLERLPNGKYTLDTHVANNEADHYLGSNGYIDASVTEWIITEPKSGTYALTLDGTSYWGYDGSGTVLANALTDPTQKNAQWQLVTRAELENALSKATLNNGVDATFYIQGHSFSRNHNENAAWMGEPVLGGPVHDMNAEKFNTTPLDIYQELSGMPNGYYVVEVQGFYRDNVDPNVTAERRAAGGEQLRASLYAGVYSVPLKSILDGATAEQLNAGIQTSYGWVPNSMDETASYFAQGLYINKVDAWVTDGTLRIGIRKETGEEGDWVIFDNFRLTYYGTKAPAGIDPSTLNSQPSTIYDLTGRKVADAENLKGGIYIVNGKKVVIK